jgi:hypothetical protein
MDDPFNTRWDLIPGNSPPYTDDNDGYDPTSSLAVYGLPKLGPADLSVPPAPTGDSAPQDQSAALLDPSAFAPPADLGILGPVATPPIPVTSMGKSFDVPLGTNFNNEYRAGGYIGNEPLSQQFDDILKAIGHHGKFDYQRVDGPFNPDYRDASNYGVGVLMRGAGYSWPATAALSTLYSIYEGRPGIIPHDWPLWGEGYDAAASGQLPKGEGR